jgi:predicted RNase H-like HicB family nuclease
MAKYVVDLERDEDGWWVASVRHVAGVHTQGRSIEEAVRRVREALSLVRHGTDTAELEPVVKLPQQVRARVREFVSVRKRFEVCQGEFGESSRATVRYLTTDAQMSVRDVGKILGISHQRVQQLKDEG